MSHEARPVPVVRPWRSGSAARRFVRGSLAALAVGVSTAFVGPVGVGAAAASGPAGTMTKAEFIAASVVPAQAGQREYGVPASVTIAQAILESGWGRSGLASQNKNFFGIKCFNGSPGPVAIGCQSWNTSECLPVCAPTTATFRVYATAADSFRDHSVFLTTNKRYKPAFAYTNDPNAFLWHMWKAGYATSPTYYDNVSAVMRTYNLYQYDIAGRGASFDSDARADLVYIDANGVVRAFRNVNGLNGFPYPSPAVEVARGFDPARTWFADLDGDGRTEILYLDQTGTVKAFRNVNGLNGFPYPNAPVEVARGFEAARTMFADLDGDGRSEIVFVDPTGTVRAFRNVNGFNGFPYPNGPVAVGHGFEAARTRFADLDGDGRSEIVFVDPTGTVQAFRNVNGFNGFPYPQAPVVIGTGFVAARTRFADIDGDSRGEIVYVDATGTVKAFRNVNGLTGFPYPQAPVAIGYGFDPARTLFGQ